MSILPYNWAASSGRVGLARSFLRTMGASRNRMYGSGRLSMRNARSARQRAGRSFTQSRNRKRMTSGIGVTEQHDARLIYKKRPMARGRRRRWRAFSKKVKAVSEKDLGTQQVLFNKSNDFVNVTSGSQVVASQGLYTLQSSITYMNDLKYIASTFLANAATTPDTGLSIAPSTKIMFQSAILDLTIRNASTFFDGATNALNSQARMEVDVYECTINHSAEEVGSTYNSPLAMFAQNPLQTQAIGGTGTEIDITLRGSTPFDHSYALSRFNIRIWSKRKYQIANGDQVTYQVRDPRRHSLVYREMSNQDGFNKPGLSRFIIIIGKLAPGLPVGTTINTFQEVLTIGCSRKYTFKVENYSEDRTGYLVA